jgi:hypothetical protein
MQRAPRRLRRRAPKWLTAGLQIALCQYIRESKRRPRRCLGGAQIVGRRFSGPTIRNDVERHLLTFVEAAHPGALNCADVHEDVLAAGFRLDEAETFLRIKPLNCSPGHGEVLSLAIIEVGCGARELAAISRFVDFGEVSVTCAPQVKEAKRPSRSANHRLGPYGDETRRFQGMRTKSSPDHCGDAALGRGTLRGRL